MRPKQVRQPVDLADAGRTRMKAGTEWRKDIAAAISRARVAVLLSSADFFASDLTLGDLEGRCFLASYRPSAGLGSQLVRSVSPLFSDFDRVCHPP
jgi:hypothetical protein